MRFFIILVLVSCFYLSLIKSDNNDEYLDGVCQHGDCAEKGCHSCQNEEYIDEGEEHVDDVEQPEEIVTPKGANSGKFTRILSSTKDQARHRRQASRRVHVGLL